MEKEHHLHDPWLVAAWPGMGSVAISADYYLMAKLGMHLLAEYPAGEFFEFEKVDVKGGLIQAGRLPRSRLFLWHDPHKVHDLILFIGEAQPPTKGGEFCSQLIKHARKLGVRRVFTFAAMATQMRPEEESKVFGAAIDPKTLEDFKRLNLEILEEGHISGLNGVLLAIAANHGMGGGCLLGEMPFVFSQFPFPKASLAVLKAFAELARLDIDLTELSDQAKQVDKGLKEFLHHLESAFEPLTGTAVTETPMAEPEESTSHISNRDKRRLEELFEDAREDRAKAYLLKQELDRLKVFQEYEDRFLDLFREPS